MYVDPVCHDTWRHVTSRYDGMTSRDVLVRRHDVTAWRLDILLKTFGQEYWQRGHVAGGRVNALAFSWLIIIVISWSIKDFQSYFRIDSPISISRFDAFHILESRGLFYWRGSSIRDYTVFNPHPQYKTSFIGYSSSSLSCQYLLHNSCFARLLPSYDLLSVDLLIVYFLLFPLHVEHWLHDVSVKFVLTNNINETSWKWKKKLKFNMFNIFKEIFVQFRGISFEERKGKWGYYKVKVLLVDF